MSLEDYHSCDFCSDYIIDVNGTLYNGKINPKSSAANEIFLLSNKHLSDVRRSASADCDFCKWLIAQWILCDPDTYHHLLGREDTVLLYATTYSQYLLDRFPIDEIPFFGLWNGQDLETSGAPRCLIRTNAPIDVFTPEGDAADQFICNRPINPRIGSPKSCARARSWLQTCVESHSSCPKPSHTFMPKRVLHISSDDSCTTYAVRISVNEPPAPYVALSYCWGGDQPYKTTKARIESGQLDLTWERIPKTIQDAVKSTLSLGVEYLWIDAFCIIQDDDSDFTLQMAEVPTIYARSIITIGASRAATASQGFLDEINLADDTTLAVRLHFQCPSGKFGSIFITCIPKSRLQEPIRHRAWTMQEFYLPVRLLQFESYQLRWHCSNSDMQIGFAEQAFTDGWKRGNNPNDEREEPAWSFPYTKNFFAEYAKMGMPTAERHNIALSHWHSFIPTYTSRSLTFAKDRPWAASGTAEAWATITQDDYLAGHWRKSLPSGLLWRIMTDERGINFANKKGAPLLGHRLKEFVGPSWSWTSVLGPANFLYAGAAEKDTRLVLQDVSIKLVEPKALYGAVEYGYVTVQGRLREALYSGKFSEKGVVAKLEKSPSEGIDSNLVITKAFPDAIEPEFLPSPQQGHRDTIPVQLLEVGHCRGTGKRGPVGLILRQTSTSIPIDSKYPTFKRLGMFHIDEKASKQRQPQFSEKEWDHRTGMELCWFDTCESRLITII
ncbi:HET-domain-containing protein [Xylaria palmicola]|nr:HET-domain-containing protein [Xylaria palmicola]